MRQYEDLSNLLLPKNVKYYNIHLLLYTHKICPCLLFIINIAVYNSVTQVT